MESPHRCNHLYGLFHAPPERNKMQQVALGFRGAVLADLPTGGEGILGSACLQAVAQAAPGHALMRLQI